MTTKEVKAKHKEFAKALAVLRSVPSAAKECGLSRQWGYEIANRLGWEKVGWGRVARRVDGAAKVPRKAPVQPEQSMGRSADRTKRAAKEGVGPEAGGEPI
jgi:hypothetical protein